MRPQEQSFLQTLATTTNYEGQLNALEFLIANAEKQYSEMLLLDAPNDLAAFAEYVDPEWIPAPHHQVMIDKLEKTFVHGENGRLIVSMPMGHGKSVYSSVSAPAYIFGQNPHERIIAAGHTQAFVEKAIARKVRGILQTEQYRQIFPNSIISQDSRASDYFTLVPQRPGSPGHYVARGAGGGISGYRATRIVADDLYPSISDANSKAFRETVSSWFAGDLKPRLLPGGNIVLVTTRFHSADLVGELIDAMNKGGERWDTVILPAICEDPETDPMGRKEGEALWPDFHTIESLMVTKGSVSARVWNTMYQCNPGADDSGIIKEDWLTRWEELPPENMIRRRFVSFDVANTTGARADYTVGTAWIETLSKKYYLVDIVRARVEFTELIRLVNSFAERNKASSILVEDAGHGKALLQSYQGKMVSPLITISAHQKSKLVRFDEVSPMFEAGTVVIPQRHELLAELERELLSYPNVIGGHDDIIDSISQALRWARGLNIRRGTKKLGGTY